MKRELRTTSDGSRTIFVPELDEHYHSFHGAYSESIHVFIHAGLKYLKKPEVHILEIGFGTGLNALVTYRAAEKEGIKIHYTGVEAYPVIKEEWEQLEYTSIPELSKLKEVFRLFHTSPWEEDYRISDFFSLIKQQRKFSEIRAAQAYDLIFFDAFAPSAQPDLWTTSIFNQMYQSLRPGGVLVTYCAKGQVKRNMKEAGFNVERLPGPPGKREMTRALKPD